MVKNIIKLLSEGKTFASDQEFLEEINSVGKALGMDFRLEFSLKNKIGKVKITKVEKSEFVFGESEDVSVKDEKNTFENEDKTDFVPEEQSNTEDGICFLIDAEERKCPECKKEYKHKKSLKTHLEQMHSIFVSDEIQCNDCDETFLPGQMRQHIRNSHTTSYECKDCGKAFISNSKLRRHQLVHTKETPFGCTFEGCEKRFSLDFNLRTHLKLHTGERPFVCRTENCKKSFTQFINLKTHMTSHSRKKSI